MALIDPHRPPERDSLFLVIVQGESLNLVRLKPVSDAVRARL